MVEKHLNLVRKVAWSFAKRFPFVEFEELFAEAVLSCLENEDKYKPERGAETTFLYYVARSCLQNYVARVSRFQQRCQSLDLIEEEELSGEDSALWEVLVSELSDDARVLYEYLTSKNRASLQSAQRELHWTKERMNRAVDELRELVA